LRHILLVLFWHAPRVGLGLLALTRWAGWFAVQVGYHMKC